MWTKKKKIFWNPDKMLPNTLLGACPFSHGVTRDSVTRTSTTFWKKKRKNYPLPQISNSDFNDLLEKNKSGSANSQAGFFPKVRMSPGVRLLTWAMGEQCVEWQTADAIIAPDSTTTFHFRTWLTLVSWGRHMFWTSMTRTLLIDRRKTGPSLRPPQHENMGDAIPLF